MFDCLMIIHIDFYNSVFYVCLYACVIVYIYIYYDIHKTDISLKNKTQVKTKNKKKVEMSVERKQITKA